MTYSDISFWSFLKDIGPGFPERFILFARYGSSTTPTGTTPAYHIPAANQVTLQPIDHGDGLEPVGLLLTEEEYRGWSLVADSKFAPDLVDGIFELSGGHVGAANDIYEAVTRSPVSSAIRSFLFCR
jgi:hypothetical protein